MLCARDGLISSMHTLPFKIISFDTSSDVGGRGADSVPCADFLDSPKTAAYIDAKLSITY